VEGSSSNAASDAGTTIIARFYDIFNLLCGLGRILHTTYAGSRARPYRIAASTSSLTMPRPKVHPSQRRRAAEACNFCRMSKKRCSATVPCTACQRRGIASSCYLTNRPRGSRSVTKSQSSLDNDEAAFGEYEPNTSSSPNVWTPARTSRQDQSTWPTNTTPLGPNSSSYQPISPSDSRAEVADADKNATPDSSSLPAASAGTPPLGRESHARMLLNLRGERGTSLTTLCIFCQGLTCC
jgi:hypothetical protein